MKLKSLLLGSAAMLVVSTPAFSADLLEEFNLGTCDSLGISGITAESDTDCLAISGEVTYEYVVGDYGDLGAWIVFFDGEASDISAEAGDGTIDSDSTVEWWLQFVATASSDFGQAKAWIKFEGDESETSTSDVEIAQAAVSIGGDPLTLIFGKTDSVFNDGSDEPLNWLGLFHSEGVDAGVGAYENPVATGGHVIQAVFDAGNGITLKAGLEDLGMTSEDATFVGTVEVDQDWGSAHASFAVDNLYGNFAPTWWNVHTGATIEMDMITLVGALAADNSGYWNVLGSASAELDMVTIAGSVEANSFNEVGYGASASFDATDDVTLSVGGRYLTDTDNGDYAMEVAGNVEFAVSDNLTATGTVGWVDETFGIDSTHSYVKGSLDWAPGGGFTAGIAAEANSFSAYKITTTAGKTFE